MTKKRRPTPWCRVTDRRGCLVEGPGKGFLGEGRIYLSWKTGRMSVGGCGMVGVFQAETVKARESDV